LRQQKRIAQGAKARPQKIFDVFGAPKSFAKKKSRDALRPTNFIPLKSTTIQLFARR
jgi:hypothetical protein